MTKFINNLASDHLSLIKKHVYFIFDIVTFFTIRKFCLPKYFIFIL